MGQATAEYDRPSGGLPAGPSLFITAPEDLRGVRLEITARTAVIGREGDLVLSADGISRRHARVWRANGSTWIEDFGSTNGTYVNGVELTKPVELHVGDVVVLGEVKAQFVEGVEGRAASETIVSGFAPPRPIPHTEATRYLCAANHLDEEYSERVIATLLEQPYRAVAPSYGVDLPRIVEHALAARRRRLLRDAALAALLIVLLVVFGRALLSWLGSENSRGERDSLANTLLDAVWPAVLLLVPAWLIVAAETWVTRALVLSRLTAGRFDPTALRIRVGRRRIQSRLDKLAESQAGNVVVFSGFNPFVGSGFPIDNWSFAVDVTKGRKDPQTGKPRTPKPFEAEHLHTALAGALERLGLPGLMISERLFVDGRDVAQYPKLLPRRLARPETRVEPEVIRQSMRSLENAARAYLSLETSGWRGHLIVTIYLRAVRLPRSLFIEASSFVLLPLKDEYYAVDKLPLESKAETALVALGGGIARTVPRLLSSPFRVLRLARRVIRATRRRRHERAIISEGWRFNYGAKTSIREEAQGEWYNRYFLLLDHHMYVKVAYQRLLLAIGEFLEQHEVDTAEFAERQTIINQNNTVANVSNASNFVIGGRDPKAIFQQQPGSGAQGNAGAGG